MADPVVELHGACEHGELAVMRQLLDAGVKADGLNDGDDHHQTPLQTAILNEQHEAVELLLERGANIEAVSWRGTPLLLAVEDAPNEDIAGLLLDRGASAHAVKELDGSTALHNAACSGLLVIMGRLIDMGLSVDVRDNDGQTALHWACRSGYGFAN
jgi:ankyrin repeat protein